MLKVLFAGGGLVGFALAAFVGLGFNPVSAAGGHSSSTAKSNVSAPVQPKAELGGKTLINAATTAASSILGTTNAAPAGAPAAAPAPAFDPAAIANSLSSITGGSDPAAATPTTTGGSTDDLSGLLDQFSGLIGGGKNAKGGTSNVNINDLMNLIGGGR